MNSKLSARFHFVRASVSSGFRAPTPGQQNGFNISTIFDPALGDLVNNGTIPSISPVAALRGGQPLAPEQSINYTAGVVFDTGQFTFTANYFRINVSDRIGITSNFTLTADEIDTLLADGVDAARDLRQFRFFTNAFATASQGIDLVSTFTDASESHLTVGLYVLVSALCSEIFAFPYESPLNPESLYLPQAGEVSLCFRAFEFLVSVEIHGLSLPFVRDSALFPSPEPNHRQR